MKTPGDSRTPAILVAEFGRYVMYEMGLEENKGCYKVYECCPRF